MGNAECILTHGSPLANGWKMLGTPGSAMGLALQLDHADYSCSAFFKDFYNDYDLVCVGEDHTRV